MSSIAVQRRILYPEPTLPKVPLLISLFCGPGGFDEGFRQAGYQSVLAADVNPSFVMTHRHNHESHGCHSIVQDLGKTDPKDLVRLWRERTDRTPAGIIGGPPCQSFSRSNRSKQDDDPRDELLYHYGRLVEGINAEFGLDFFVFENVPDLNASSHKACYMRFKDQCERAGFHITEALLDAANHMVPQHRMRLFIIGLNKNKGLGTKFLWPPGNENLMTVKQALKDLPEPVYFKRDLDPNSIPYHPNHWCMNPRSKRFEDGSLSPGSCRGRSLRVLDWEKPSWTVAYGHNEVHVHPDCRRRLSVYEAMCLQGFPETYHLRGTMTQQFAQVSEAVAPPVARALGEAIGKCLGYCLQPPVQYG